jgi:hypothetical protein
MKYIITESKMKESLNHILMMEGFDNIEYDWCDYNCGMGVCCDPYCIIFGNPAQFDYFFKLVDSSNYDELGKYPSEMADELPEPCYDVPNIHDDRFDTVIVGEEFSEKLIGWVGPISNWPDLFLDILKEQYNINAKYIYFSSF